MLNAKPCACAPLNVASCLVNKRGDSLHKYGTQLRIFLYICCVVVGALFSRPLSRESILIKLRSYRTITHSKFSILPCLLMHMVINYSIWLCLDYSMKPTQFYYNMKKETFIGYMRMGRAGLLRSRMYSDRSLESLPYYINKMMLAVVRDLINECVFRYDQFVHRHSCAEEILLIVQWDLIVMFAFRKSLQKLFETFLVLY